MLSRDELAFGGETDMAWSSDQLERIGQAEELYVSTYQSDGTLRKWTPIWVVRVGDDLYVRSAFGNEGGWYRNAMRDQTARIRAGAFETDVGLQSANDPATNAEVEAAYESKYRAQPGALRSMIGSPAADTTMRLVNPTG
jgi:hypothetical protein